MSCLTRAKKLTAWFILVAMALTMLSVLSACRETEQDMHVPAEIMRNPETPLVYPGESFVPTAEPTPEPPSEPTPTPHVMAMYSNPYECYYGQLKKLLHGEALEYVDVTMWDISQMELCRNNGEVSIEAWGSIYRDWGEKIEKPIFIFPNPDIWYDIFPPGEKIADCLVTPEDWHYHKGDADAEIVIPEYDQEADGSWKVIFGGDWMVVSLPWGRDDYPYRRFKGTYDGYSDWHNSPFAQYAHTCILRTDDNWKTWERWDSSGADAIASHEICGAYVSSYGMGYISYKRWSNHYNAGVSFNNDQGSYEIMMTHDGGKTWESVGEEIAQDIEPFTSNCCLFPAYFEGLHGLARIMYRVSLDGLGYHYKDYLFVESYDGGYNWIIRDTRHDEEKGWHLDRGTANSDGK